MDALTLSTSSSEEILQIVTFNLENEEYGLEILKVQEINRMTEITRLPNSPAHVEGVINLRGKVIPVISLRKRFKFPPKEKDELSRIVIMEVQSVIMGLIVDSVSQVLNIPRNAIDPTPPMGTSIDTEFIKGIAKLEGRLIILLDMDKLIDRPEAESVAVATQGNLSGITQG